MFAFAMTAFITHDMSVSYTLLHNTWYLRQTIVPPIGRSRGILVDTYCDVIGGISFIRISEREGDSLASGNIFVLQKFLGLQVRKNYG